MQRGVVCNITLKCNQVNPLNATWLTPNMDLVNPLNGTRCGLQHNPQTQLQQTAEDICSKVTGEAIVEDICGIHTPCPASQPSKTFAIRFANFLGYTLP